MSIVRQHLFKDQETSLKHPTKTNHLLLININYFFSFNHRKIIFPAGEKKRQKPKPTKKIHLFDRSPPDIYLLRIYFDPEPRENYIRKKKKKQIQKNEIENR